jgi:hypothetical protein
MIKFITRLIGVIIILLIVSPANAEEAIKGHYCYTYGDKESLKEAKDLTRTLAIRNAVESYRVYIESTTTVRNFTLTNDIIQIVSSGYLKNMKVIDHKEEGRTICDTIEFTVSPREIEKVIRQAVKRGTQAVEEKGIDNNGYFKILTINESEEENFKYEQIEYEVGLKRIRLPGVHKIIEVKVKVLRKIYSKSEYCILFIVYYDSEGREVSTDRRDSGNTYFEKWLYPGEIIDYNFTKRDNVSSYKIWLYSEKRSKIYRKNTFEKERKHP